MKKLIISLVAFCTLLAVSAETVKISAAHKKLAEELLSKLELKSKIETSFSQIKALQNQIINKTLKNAQDSAETQKLRNEITAIIKKELSWDAIKGKLTDMYARTYSESELKALNKFFSSTAGKKFISKTPKLQRDFLELFRKQLKGATSKTRLMAVAFMKKQMLAGKTKMPKSIKTKK